MDRNRSSRTKSRLQQKLEDSLLESKRKASGPESCKSPGSLEGRREMEKEDQFPLHEMRVWRLASWQPYWGGGRIGKRARNLKELVVMLKRICRLWPASEVKYRRKEIVISSWGKAGGCRGISRGLTGSALGCGNSGKEKHVPLRWTHFLGRIPCSAPELPD